MRPKPSLLQTFTRGEGQLQKVCGMSGLTQEAIEGRIANLNALLRALDQGIAEAERAEREEVRWTRAIAVARLVVAGCDLFMDIVTKNPAMDKLPLTKAIGFVYDQKDTIAEATTGKIDAPKAMTRVAGSVGGAVGKVGASGANLVIDAARKDLTAGKVTLFGLTKNVEMLAWSLEQEGKTQGAKLLRNAKSVFDTGVAVFAAFDEASGASGIASAKQSLVMLSRRFSAELQKLNVQLISCDDLTRPLLLPPH